VFIDEVPQVKIISSVSSSEKFKVILLLKTGSNFILKFKGDSASVTKFISKFYIIALLEEGAPLTLGSRIFSFKKVVIGIFTSFSIHKVYQ
jgi:hypothetical protein